MSPNSKKLKFHSTFFIPVIPKISEIPPTLKFLLYEAKKTKTKLLNTTAARRALQEEYELAENMHFFFSWEDFTRNQGPHQ